VPAGANVTFEIDVQDDDILGILKQLLGALGASMNDKAVSVPGPKGSVSVDLAEIKDLFKNIHRIHAVTYETKGNDGMAEAAEHEATFRKLGLHRLIYIQDERLVSVLRSPGVGGMAFIMVNDNAVTVGRTDGMVNFQVFGKLIGAIIPAVVPQLAQFTTNASAPKPAVAADAPKPGVAVKAAAAKPTKKKKGK